MSTRIYPGIDEDPQGAMNPTGNIIRDAWVFGLIPETETCGGWTAARIQGLYEQVSAACPGDGDNALLIERAR